MTQGTVPCVIGAGALVGAYLGGGLGAGVAALMVIKKKGGNTCRL